MIAIQNPIPEEIATLLSSAQISKTQALEGATLNIKTQEDYQRKLSFFMNALRIFKAIDTNSVKENLNELLNYLEKISPSIYTLRDLIKNLNTLNDQTLSKKLNEGAIVLYLANGMYKQAKDELISILGVYMNELKEPTLEDQAVLEA